MSRKPISTWLSWTLTTIWARSRNYAGITRIDISWCSEELKMVHKRA